MINIDLYDYPNVDLVCDISQLPFKNNSIDLIISIAVLEHVPDPKIIVEEIARVLKPGGKIYIYIPFIQGFHASPYDYQRYTISGIKHLFNDFDVMEARCGSGPSSGFLWIFQEWLAILLSFGIKPLYRLLHILVMLLTFPVKFLDILFIHHPFAMNIASAFTIIAKKRKS
jgi:SAM-dependent methyltransferase